ncbi:F-box protein CPR1-like [Silene latifolia]|uniref:F-box protein CPR1-like n=1 Tax=Silene latifolia TaxID=37657 RepID=UPI003D782F20
MAAVRNPCTKTIMVSIPNEIITNEILPKLPAKSLVRFKCVSKSFNTLISSPDFINLHLQQSLTSSANRLLILAKEDSSDLYSFDIDSSDSDTTAVNIPLPHTLDKWLDDGIVSIIGSFNGLLCVGLKRDIDGTDEYKHVVINPSTGVFSEVPYKYSPVSGDLYYHISFGFGYDDINKDNKLVRVVENVDRYHYYQGDELYNREVMVYSLNENTWKLVEDVYQPKESLQSRNGVLMKNHLLHWLFWCSVRYCYIIYCFDIRFEKWVDEVPLVDLFTDRMADFEERKDTRFEMRNLGVIDGCLCFTARSNLTDVVWMMKEYGVKESWIKLFEISSCFHRCRSSPCWYYFDGPYGFRQGAKQEVLVRRPRKLAGLFWCNIGSEANGETEEISGIPVFDQACFFTGSLVPIPGSKLIISPDK